MNPTLLHVHEVTKTFLTSDGPLTAVDQLSLDIPTGEIVCLLGPNGAGKTTLLDMILGLISPTAEKSRSQGQPRAKRLVPGKSLRCCKPAA